jgi:hypothetical protein
MKKREDLANHLGYNAGFDVVNTKFQSAAAFVIPHMERAYVYVRDVIEDTRFQAFADKRAYLLHLAGTC